MGSTLPPPLEDFGPPRPPQCPQVAKNGCWSYNLGYFSTCTILIYFLGISAFFPRPLAHLGTPGGAPGAPKWPPQGGTPNRYLPLIIWTFYVSGISKNNYLGITSKKNGTDQTLGSPQAIWGGVLGGCEPWGAPQHSSVPFFLLFLPK